MSKNIRNVTSNATLGGAFKGAAGAIKQRVAGSLKPRMPAIPIPSQKVVTAIVGAALITATFCTTRVLARKKAQAEVNRKLAEETRAAKERLRGGEGGL